MDIVDEGVDSLELLVGGCFSNSVEAIDLNFCLGVDVVLISDSVLVISSESVLGGEEALDGDIVEGGEEEYAFEDGDHFPID